MPNPAKGRLTMFWRRRSKNNNQAVGDTSADRGGIAQGGAGNVQQNAPDGKIFNLSFSLFGLFGRPARTQPTSSGPKSAAIGPNGPRQQMAPSALPPTPSERQGVPVLPRMPEILYGPRDVFVPLNPRSNTIAYFPTEVPLLDLDAQTLIHIPYSLGEGKWSAGFRLRIDWRYVVVGDYVFISSDGKWYQFRSSSSGVVEVASGGHYAIRTKFPGANFVRLVADGKVGALIINDALPVWLELQETHFLLRKADLIGSYFTGDGVAGKAVQFEALEIRTRRRKS